MLTKVAIIGAGGHAKVVVDALLLNNPSAELQLYDQNPKGEFGRLIPKIAIEKLDDIASINAQDIHIAIGNNLARKEIAEKVAEAKLQLISIIHPNASVSVFSLSATVGRAGLSAWTHKPVARISNVMRFFHFTLKWKKVLINLRAKP